MQSLAARKSFDGQHMAPLNLTSEHEAGIDRLSVHENRTGATIADIAAKLGAGQPEAVAQQFEQCRFRRNRGGSPMTVDDHRYGGHRLYSLLCASARAWAHCNARLVSTVMRYRRYSALARKSVIGLASAAAIWPASIMLAGVIVAP